MTKANGGNFWEEMSSVGVGKTKKRLTTCYHLMSSYFNTYFPTPEAEAKSRILEISKIFIQCSLDLVTSYLVTNPDLVTVLQKTIFFST